MSLRVLALSVPLLVLVHCGSGSTPASDSSSTDPTADSPDASTSSNGQNGQNGSDAASSSSGDDASAPTPTDPNCGTRTGMRGLTSRSLTVAGLKRTYLIYLPASVDATKPIPFVFVFHGYTMSGQEMHDITQYAALADSEGIGVAFPDGEGGAGSSDSPWNVENTGQTVCGYGQYASATGDDFAFIDAMKTDVAQDQCLDAAHQFSTGFSMGGYFTEHIGCYRNDFRGLAPHSGATIADLSTCTTGHVPIILFHGTGDSVIDDACDDPTQKEDPGFPAAASLWAKKNGCAATYTTTTTTGTGGGAGQCYLYDGCPADGQVELCTFTAMDHCWAGGATAGAGGNSCPTYANATQLQWDFFKAHAW